MPKLVPSLSAHLPIAPTDASYGDEISSRRDDACGDVSYASCEHAGDEALQLRQSWVPLAFIKSSLQPLEQVEEL